jgi:molybdopterin converting factor small subunit
MVAVKLWGSLRDHTEGQDVVEVEASNFKELLDALVAKYPGLKPRIDRGVSLAVDGLVYRDSWFTEVKPDSEVVLMPYMKGG